MPAMVHQLTREMTMEEIKAAGFDKYFVDHTNGVYPVSAAGVPFTMSYLGVKGDPIADLSEDMAAEQKARVTYDNILRLVDDPDILDPIRFLREREIVHYQRFGESLRIVQDNLDAKNFYASILPLTNKQTKKPLLFLGAVLYFRSYQLCVSK